MRGCSDPSMLWGMVKVVVLEGSAGGAWAESVEAADWEVEGAEV